MFEKIKSLNPEICFFSVDSEEFCEYGRVINNIDTSEIISVGEKFDFPSEGSIYEPSTNKFEELKIAEEIKEDYFGEMPTQIGYCYGHSNKLNAVEWHTSSEINIAVTPLVLILGKLCDIKNGKFDSTTMKALFVPKGKMIEVYATTLHFCPCEVDKHGFGCVVALPLGTNIPLDRVHFDKTLFRKNKWILAHVENQALVNRGVIAGVYGKNFEIK